MVWASAYDIKSKKISNDQELIQSDPMSFTTAGLKNWRHAGQSFHVLMYNSPIFCPELLISTSNVIEFEKSVYLMADIKSYKVIYTLWYLSMPT